MFHNGGGKKRTRPYPSDRADYNDEGDPSADEDGGRGGGRDEDSDSTDTGDGQTSQPERLQRTRQQTRIGNVRSRGPSPAPYIDPNARGAVRNVTRMFGASKKVPEKEKIPIPLDQLIRLTSGFNPTQIEDELRDRYDVAMGHDQGPLECYGCTHLECSPGTQDTHMNVFILYLYDFDTTHMDAHCVHASKMYDVLIRREANKTLQEGETPLPPWNPSTIKSHILYHGKNIPMWITSMIQICSSASIYIGQNLIFREEVDPGTDIHDQNRLPDIKRIVVSKDSIRALKDLTALNLQLARIDPKTINRHAVGSADLMKQMTKMALIDPTKKKIKTGHTSLAMDYYFGSAMLSVHQDGPAQIDQFGSQQTMKAAVSSTSSQSSAALVPSSRSAIHFH